MLGHELAMMLRAAYLAMHRRTDAGLARWGVTADQFVVLAALAKADALRQRELGARTSCDPNTLRAMLVLLERRGLIARRPHPTDGRARSVALTAKGRSLFRQLWRKSKPVRTRLLAPFMPDDIELLIVQLRKIVKELEMPRRAGPKTKLRPQVGAAT
jgi:DNA-binding MarR family transcriptional regulator